jgi:hypothetical protein
LHWEVRCIGRCVALEACRTGTRADVRPGGPMDISRWRQPPGFSKECRPGGAEDRASHVSPSAGACAITWQTRGSGHRLISFGPPGLQRQGLSRRLDNSSVRLAAAAVYSHRRGYLSRPPQAPQRRRCIAKQTVQVVGRFSSVEETSTGAVSATATGSGATNGSSATTVACSSSAKGSSDGG